MKIILATKSEKDNEEQHGLLLLSYYRQDRTERSKGQIMMM
jgi:hypothetical protein